MVNRDVIVIGASMGGVEGLKTLFAQLPPDLPAGVCTVLHIAPSSDSLAATLGRDSTLPVLTPRDGEPFNQGVIYVAPPDKHLLVKEGYLRVFRGPRENRSRPAIDPLFRSAGVAYGSRTIGVVLTGLQDDGSSGLAAVKRCGGVGIVQDPSDAAFPEMPLSALGATEVDYCPPLSELPELLDQLVREEAAATPPVPRDIALEAGIAERVMSDVSREHLIGRPAPFGCPECGGPLWEMDDSSVKRYRCHVGHGYTAESLLADQSDALEKALWVALRTLEERANMLRKMANDEHSRSRASTSLHYGTRAREAEEHAANIRNVLLGEAA